MDNPPPYSGNYIDNIFNNIENELEITTNPDVKYYFNIDDGDIYNHPKIKYLRNNKKFLVCFKIEETKINKIYEDNNGIIHDFSYNLPKKYCIHVIKDKNLINKIKKQYKMLVDFLNDKTNELEKFELYKIKSCLDFYGINKLYQKLKLDLPEIFKTYNVYFISTEYITFSKRIKCCECNIM